MPPLSRRRVLRAAGAAVALPLLDAMRPACGQPPAPAPRRFVGICTNLGVLEHNFLPATPGLGYELTPYLRPLAAWRDRFTVVSGTSHPASADHASEVSFLTGAPHPGTSAFRNSISLDQFAVERLRCETRLPSLTLAVSRDAGKSLSCTTSGVMIPAETSPTRLFETLFVAGDARDVERRIASLRSGRSILDAVAERAAELGRDLGAGDRRRVDQYFTSVRELEQRLERAEAWERRPKPQVDGPAPRDTDLLLDRIRAMYDLIHLALATDSTRFVSLLIRLDGFAGHIPGWKDEPHGISHHSQRPDKIAQVEALDAAQFRLLGGLLDKLAGGGEDGGSLLDATTVLYGSNIADGSSHDWHNLPILLAGGRFRHGGHLAFDRRNNAPLPNLFVSILQQLGVEADRFASSTGPLAGLEWKA